MQYPMRFQTGRPRARVQIKKTKKKGRKKKGKRKEGEERVSNA